MLVHQTYKRDRYAAAIAALAPFKSAGRASYATHRDLKVSKGGEGADHEAWLSAKVQAAVSALSERHQKALPALLAGGDIDYLRDVYPFHPALIEMLVDVTSLMQRERSALRMLYELLVVHYPCVARTLTAME
jgi:hypothetical protein